MFGEPLPEEPLALALRLAAFALVIGAAAMYAAAAPHSRDSVRPVTSSIQFRTAGVSTR